MVRNTRSLIIYLFVKRIGLLLPPANEVWGKVIFLHQFVILFTGGGVCGCSAGGACMVLFGGACMVLFGGCAWFYVGGHVWLLWGGMRGFIWGGVRGFIQGGMHGFIQGACVVLFGGGGMRGFFSFFGYNEIRSMSGRYASYWNAFLLIIDFYTSRRLV